MIIPCLLTFRDEKEGDLDSKRYNIECKISRLDLKNARKYSFKGDLSLERKILQNVTNIYRYLFYLNLN